MRQSIKSLGLFLLMLGAQRLYAQSYVGVSYNVFLESYSEGSSPSIMTENVNSLSIRFAKPNMFAEIRWQKFNLSDHPRWADPREITYDSTTNQFNITGGFLNPVYQSNQFTLNYIRFIIGPRFELFDHIAYEIGSSVDILIHKKSEYADFENNPYRIPNWGAGKWNIQEANVHFYSRIQAWYNLSERWRISTFWEFNIPIENVLVDGTGYSTNEGKSVHIEPIKNGAQFFLNFMLEFKLN